MVSSLHSPIALDWSRLMSLRVVEKFAALIDKRWNLALGYLDPARSHIFRPSKRQLCTCPDRDSDLVEMLNMGLLQSREVLCREDFGEILSPLVVRGQLVGALVCGDYVAKEHRHQYIAPLKHREKSFLQELVEEAGSEIVSYLEAQEQFAVTGNEFREGYHSIVGKSAGMQQIYSILDKVAKTESTVLITGENGTGKELVAQAIHKESLRRKHRLVATNCSAFHDSLLDSELFGHKKGSFTGASHDKQGLFEVADKGTFFMDEIGDMSPALQVKLLRVLQEGSFTPVGGTQEKKVDVRIVAATHRNLEEMVESGEFRQDLFFRVNVIHIHLPSLRHRREDIPLLAEHFLRKHGGFRKKLSAPCLRQMAAYAWPGNVRELENEIERLIVMSDGEESISLQQLSPKIREAESEQEPLENSGSLPAALQRLEKRMIYAALLAHDWNKTHAAEELQISRRNLIRLVQKYELEKKRPKTIKF